MGSYLASSPSLVELSFHTKFKLHRKSRSDLIYLSGWVGGWVDGWTQNDNRVSLSSSGTEA